METDSNSSDLKPDTSWIQIVLRYNKPDFRKSLWQLINSLVPYLALWALMYISLKISYWITLLLAIPAGGFLIRIFIIFHDCGHGSFFKSRKLNDIIGTLLGILTFTPYYKWHHNHKIHHATVGDLDKRGIGDVWTLTHDEYYSLPKRKRIFYRIYRNPFIMFIIGPVYIFIIQNRFTQKGSDSRDRFSVYFTNISLFLLILLMFFTMSGKIFLLIQLPVFFVAFPSGVWLFYVQHQFDDVAWFRHEKWDYKTVALKGSSFLKLPKILQWFSGNIGFHHIHHLSPKIPNYNLPKCHYENPLFHDVKPIPFLKSLRSLVLRLWDEQTQRLIGFNKLRFL